MTRTPRCDLAPDDRTARPCRAPERARPPDPRALRRLRVRRAAPCASLRPRRHGRDRRALLVARDPRRRLRRSTSSARCACPARPAFIVGHRGDRAEAPENTMPSLELAMDELAFVETDVQLTPRRRAGALPRHDARAHHGRSAVGRRARPRRRCAASTWAPGTAAESRGGADPDARRVPHGARRPRRPPARSSSSRPTGTPDEVRTVVDLIERHGLRGRVVLQSFSLETLFAVQRVVPDDAAHHADPRAPRRSRAARRATRA